MCARFLGQGVHDLSIILRIPVECRIDARQSPRVDEKAPDTQWKFDCGVEPEGTRVANPEALHRHETHRRDASPPTLSAPFLSAAAHGPGTNDTRSTNRTGALRMLI